MGNQVKNKRINFSDKMRLQLFFNLLRIRMVEEKIIELYPEQEMRCPTHISIPQEAIAVGVCAHLKKSDYVMSAHRSHAHYLAKGGDLKAMFAELYGKETGCAKGKGGSMHLIDKSVGFLGCVPIVGSTIPIGVGISFGARMLKQNNLTVIFFGDAATETGVFYESINFAALHKLPVLFVCENNLYSVNTGLSERQPEGHGLIEVAKAKGIEAIQADGQDIEIVYKITEPMIENLQKGIGPYFLEFMTYRKFEHCGPFLDTDLGYRPEGEFEWWEKRDPVDLYSRQLIDESVLGQKDIEKFNHMIQEEIDEAIDFAKRSKFPDKEQLMDNIYAV